MDILFPTCAIQARLGTRLCVGSKRSVYISTSTAQICRNRRRRWHLNLTLNHVWIMKTWSRQRHWGFNKRSWHGGIRGLSTCNISHLHVYHCFLHFGFIHAINGQAGLVSNILRYSFARTYVMPRKLSNVEFESINSTTTMLSTKFIEQLKWPWNILTVNPSKVFFLLAFSHCQEYNLLHNLIV